MNRVKQRREELEKRVDKKLDNVACFSLDPEKIEGRNLEQMIGCVQVPLGIAGPLRVMAEKENNEYWLPLATTEGALVASVNRGCKATRLSGGIRVRSKSVGATRGPVFRVENLEEGKRLIDWIEKERGRLKKIVSRTSEYIELKEAVSKQAGKSVWVRLVFDTGEAMGMNMVTKAIGAIAKEIKKELRVDCLAVSGNYCVDKKPSWLNFLRGRGKEVWAEAVVRRSVVKEVLKTTPEKIVKVVENKQWLGSMMSGSMGFNAHFSNVVAAMFLATGQDMAQVVEGSMGVTVAEKEGKDLYFSVYLPSLMVGTVGGGTGLATQREALSILGLEKIKKGDAVKLAEVIGAAVLAGELSLTAALASGDLVKAHERLGRGK